MSVQIKKLPIITYIFLVYLLLLVSCSNPNRATVVTETQQIPDPTSTIQMETPTPAKSVISITPSLIDTISLSPTATIQLPADIAFIALGDPNVLGILKDKELIKLVEGCIFCDSISWSPDGKKIAFNASFKVGDVSQIYTIAIDNGELSRITSDAHPKWGLSWSPDGQSILYIEYIEEGSPTVLVQRSLDGKIIKRFLGLGYVTSPAWSPDGNYIAFLSNESPSAFLELWLIEKSGENPRKLTDALASFNTISWSPDGDEILFVSGGNCGILSIIDIDSENIKEFTEFPGCVENPSLSPDGSLIMFIGSKSKDTPLWLSSDWKIYVMSSDGKSIAPLQEKLPGRPKISVWGPLIK